MKISLAIPAVFLSVFLGFLYSPDLHAVEYTGKDFPDPFADMALPDTTGANLKTAAEATEKAFTSLSIQWILVAPAGSMAIVNSKVLKVGGVILGFKVVQIDAQNVYFEDSTHKSYKLKYKKRVNA